MDRVAFSLFGKDIYWYGIIIATALIIGVVLGVIEAKRRGYRSDMVLDFMLIAIPICIVCARLYYVIFAWSSYSGDLLRMLAIWEGGLAIYGAVIGGVIAAIIFFRWRRVPVGEIMDIAAPSIIIAQAIGRWGNFVNQEAHGGIITDKAWQWFPAGVNIEGVWYQATFFYESAWNVLVFIFLMLIRKKVKIRGGIFALYLALYGFGRFWIEAMRTDSLMWNNVRVSQALGAIFFVGGLAYIIFRTWKKKEYKPYDGLYCISWTEAQINEYKANAKKIKAEDKAIRAQEKAAAMLEKNDIAASKVQKAEDKARKAKKKADLIEDKIKISEIKAHNADDDSLDITQKEKKKAQKAKEKIGKLSSKSAAAKEKIEKAEKKVETAEEKAKEVEMKTKKAEQAALKKAADAKKAEMKAADAKNKLDSENKDKA